MEIDVSVLKNSSSHNTACTFSRGQKLFIDSPTNYQYFWQVIFGNYRYAHTNYYSDNEIGFQHLFLKVRAAHSVNFQR